MTDLNFYIPFKEENFSNKNCFLCGLKPKSKKTKEHIFPKWLQHQFDLWDNNLIITNGTKIPYRNLTVPCCDECNNDHLSKMETKFKTLLDNSFENLTLEDEMTIFQWTAKILYATRYKELTLLIDRKNPDLGKILTPSEIESYSTLHLFLQSIRFKTNFNEVKPWSIFIFKTDDDKFYYQNELNFLSLSIKLGGISIVIAFEDNNCIESYMQPLKELRNLELNFAQYVEVTSFIFYSAYLKEKIPSYYATFNGKTEELNINPANRIYGREWNDEEFGTYFDFRLDKCGLKRYEKTYQGNGILSTYLIDENGNQLLRKYTRK